LIQDPSDISVSSATIEQRGSTHILRHRVNRPPSGFWSLRGRMFPWSAFQSLRATPSGRTMPTRGRRCGRKLWPGRDYFELSLARVIDPPRGGSSPTFGSTVPLRLGTRESRVSTANSWTDKGVVPIWCARSPICRRCAQLEFWAGSGTRLGSRPRRGRCI
jgi:hypothetical protein